MKWNKKCGQEALWTSKLVGYDALHPEDPQETTLMNLSCCATDSGQTGF